MKRTILALAFFSIFSLTSSLLAQNDGSQKYSEKYSKKVIYTLTDDKYRGRESGTEEIDDVVRFISREFRKNGLAVNLQKATSEELSEQIGAPKPGKTYPDNITNIIARIEGRTSDKYVVIGAHFDHLGFREGLGIHPGADDNASGIATILNLAKMLKSTGATPEYTILLCAWDGEEKGLLGSKYFTSTWGTDSICYYMNFDMVGRTDDPNDPNVTFAWNNNYPELLENCKTALTKVPKPFTVLYDERTGDGKGGSDYAPFSKKNIPFVAWMEDELHEDYHKPTDTPDKISWDKLEKTVKLSYWVIYEWVFSK